MKNILLFCCIVAQLHAQQLTRYVNPFIGTAKGGNTFPGAVRPWGMVSVSPHTTLNSPSGYIHGEKFFYGFGQVHLSGTGCADLGSIILTASRNLVTPDPDLYKCTYSDELASPGYYSVHLNEPNLKTEASATTRCGMIRLTSLTDGNISLLINVGRNLSMIGGGSIKIISNKEIEGYNIGGGFCGKSNRHKVFFVARFNLSSTARGIWKGNTISDNDSATIQDSALGGWMSFPAKQNQPILVKIGISYVSAENARKNLDAEIPRWDFDRVRKDAEASWEKELSRLSAEGGSDTDRVKFYTALYHCLIHPNIISDVNFEYPKMNHTGIGKHEGRNRYSVFSLWDTYRTLHPLLTLFYPEQESEMAQTIIDMYRESGWLPHWELAGNETHMMVGDPAAIVLTDTHIKGVKGMDIVLAYEAMKKPTQPAGEKDALAARPGYHEFLKYGYIPFEQDTTQPWWVWGPASVTLEYCLADFAIAQFAKSIDETKDALEYTRRSQFYKNLFDSQTKFMRPKRRDGSWLAPFDPLATEGSGNWSGSGCPGYVKGNAWQYTWFVPHDVQGLFMLFGGKQLLVQKLDSCMNNGQFTINNEPDIGYPYIFSYLPGEEWRTQKYVGDIMEKQFGVGADGLPGNDDCGTISAWYVFSALGIYPACPASNEYRVTAPLFPKTTIHFNERVYGGTTLIIQRSNNVGDGHYIKSIEFNGKRTLLYRIPHSEIVKGGILSFQ